MCDPLRAEPLTAKSLLLVIQTQTKTNMKSKYEAKQAKHSLGSSERTLDLSSASLLDLRKPKRQGRTSTGQKGVLGIELDAGHGVVVSYGHTVM